MAFMHGAQDGQKFMGVFMLGIFLVNGQSGDATFCPAHVADGSLLRR